ncbi:MAG: ligase-associated DNA damage response endonuclease PdeM [Bacteroidota bacterium]
MQIPKGVEQAVIQGEEFWLLPEKALYWPGPQRLLVADLHFGKGTHFRKHGIPVSSEIQWQDLQKLEALTTRFPVRQLIFLGDLFHSTHNKAWEEVRDFLLAQSFETHLVVGNHDILATEIYEECELVCHREGWLLDGFQLEHEPMEEISGEAYVFAGHLHPGVKLAGEGLQRLRLPCFWMGEKQGILPAFGGFTGLAIIRPQVEDQVFVIVENQVVRMK